MSAKIQINSLVCAAPDVAAIGDEAFGVWVRLVVLSAQGDHLNSWLPLHAWQNLAGCHRKRVFDLLIKVRVPRRAPRGRVQDR
jgi:hypothetical protein